MIEKHGCGRAEDPAACLPRCKETGPSEGGGMEKI